MYLGGLIMVLFVLLLLPIARDLLASVDPLAIELSCLSAENRRGDGPTDL